VAIADSVGEMDAEPLGEPDNELERDPEVLAVAEGDSDAEPDAVTLRVLERVPQPEPEGDAVLLS